MNERACKQVLLPGALAEDGQSGCAWACLCLRSQAGRAPAGAAGGADVLPCSLHIQSDSAHPRSKAPSDGHSAAAQTANLKHCTPGQPASLFHPLWALGGAGEQNGKAPCLLGASGLLEIRHNVWYKDTLCDVNVMMRGIKYKAH